MSNTLDLRPKQEPNIVIVEKVVLKKRTWKSEFLRMLSIMVIVSVLGWGISKADSSLTANHAPIKNFSAIGVVSSIDPSSLTISSANGSDNAFTKIETSDYHALTMNDIRVGDRVIAQGIRSASSSNSIEIHRLIDFNATSTIPEVYVPVASSTPTIIEASSTDDATSTATDTTPTDETSTTTDASSTNATSTALDTVVNTVTDAIQNIVNTVTGSSTDSN